MYMISLNYFPPPVRAQIRQKWWRDDLMRQARHMKAVGERTFHHVKAARRLNRLRLLMTQAGIKGI